MMKMNREMCKPGDRVEVIDDTVKGIVRSVKDNSVVVETHDGFILELGQHEVVKINFEEIRLNKLEIEKAKAHKGAAKRKPMPSVKREKTVPPMEVDLHIHQLTASTKGMSNFDMLTLQLETAKHKIDYAIKNRIQRIVFIHGVGEGVLKAELEYLFARYTGLRHYDADYKKYGLGATEVYLQQNASY